MKPDYAEYVGIGVQVFDVGAVPETVLADVRAAVADVLARYPVPDPATPATMRASLIGLVDQPLGARSALAVDLADVLRKHGADVALEAGADAVVDYMLTCLDTHDTLSGQQEACRSGARAVGRPPESATLDPAESDLPMESRYDSGRKKWNVVDWNPDCLGPCRACGGMVRWQPCRTRMGELKKLPLDVASQVVADGDTYAVVHFSCCPGRPARTP